MGIFYMVTSFLALVWCPLRRTLVLHQVYSAISRTRMTRNADKTDCSQLLNFKRNPCRSFAVKPCSYLKEAHSNYIILQPVLLQLHSISITQFKNYSNRSFRFNERIVGICGNNGVGKTNLLDAIHYLCFTKSYFTRDVLNIQNGQTGFRVDGELN
jgi:hypothetical protein